MLTKDQKAFILKKLESQMNTIELNCDGFKIWLSLERCKMRLVVAIYINGWFKGGWLLSKEPCPEAKYLPIKRRAVYTAKQKAQIIKALGKREAKKAFPNLDDVYEHRGAFFSSPKAALAHLIKVSETIELVTEMPA